MSRHIQGTSRLEEGHELYRREKKANKILILKNKGILYSFLVRDNRIYKVEREEKEDFSIGTVLLGKVINVAKQFGGVFFSLENLMRSLIRGVNTTKMDCGLTLLQSAAFPLTFIIRESGRETRFSHGTFWTAVFPKSIYGGSGKRRKKR